MTVDATPPGALLTRLVVAAGLWLVGLSLAAALLAGLGWWTPWTGVPVAVAVMALALGTVARLPVPPPRPPHPRGAGRRPRARPTMALVAVAIVFAGWAGATHAEQFLPRRDSASNLQAALSLAATGSRVVPVDAEALGGPAVLDRPGITVASPAFYAVGGIEDPAIQPQFVIGPAAVYGLGIWLGGPTLALLLPALLAAVALLAIGVLAGRVIGPWWGVLASAVTAAAFPMVHVARSTYSEPLALVTLGAGLLALSLAIGEPSGSRRWALLAGLLLGGTTLVRIDGLREAVLALAVVAPAVARRAPWAGSLAAGLAGGAAAGLGAAWWRSDAYLRTIAGSLVPLTVLGVLAIVATGVIAYRAGHGPDPPAPPGRAGSRLPGLLSGATGAGLLVLVSRPWWLVARQDPDDPGSRYVAGMQARQGLPVDGGRTYAEQTITWLHWWLGPVTLTLAAVALVVLVHRGASAWRAGALPPWGGPLLVAAGSTLVTLWRPAITPDHPWAERRLVIAVPLVVVLAVAALATLVRSRGARPTGWLLGGIGSAALVIPVVLATWPHAMSRVEAGQRQVVEQVCAALEPGDVVLMVDARAVNEWTQVVRGQCGRPTLAARHALRVDPEALAETVDAIDDAVSGTGGRLRLLSAGEQPPRVGVEWRTVADVTVLESQHVLERRPDGLEPLRLVVRLT